MRAWIKTVILIVGFFAALAAVYWLESLVRKGGG